MSRFTSEEMDAAMIAELCSGRKLLQERQHLREHEAAREARQLKATKSAGVLGKVVLNMPAHEWFQMTAKYGHEAMHSKEMVRDIQRLEPQFKVHNA